MPVRTVDFSRTVMWWGKSISSQHISIYAWRTGETPCASTAEARILHNLRVIRRCRDTGQSSDCSLKKEHVV
jgi:hypothetical protein